MSQVTVEDTARSFLLLAQTSSSNPFLPFPSPEPAPGSWGAPLSPLVHPNRLSSPSNMPLILGHRGQVFSYSPSVLISENSNTLFRSAIVY